MPKPNHWWWNTPDAPDTDTGLHRRLAALRPRVAAALRRTRAWGGFALAEKRCPSCHAPYDPVYIPGQTSFLQNMLCSSCAAQLEPYSGACCPLCGLPHLAPPHSPQSPSIPCGHCLTQKPPWSQLAFYGLYDNLLQSLLLRLKYRESFSLVPVLGAMLCHAYATLPPCQIVLAVPQHPDHLRERGFNQAHELAKELARIKGLPLAPHALSRTRPTPPQTRLNAQQRKDNPKNSFAAHNVAHAQVLLIDDTMTTGSTLHHATLALLAGGATSVAVAVVARTPHPDSGKAHDNCRIFV